MTQTKKRPVVNKKNNIKKDGLLELMESPYQLMVLLLIFILTFTAVGFMQRKNSLMSVNEQGGLNFLSSVPSNPRQHLTVDYQRNVVNYVRKYFEEKSQNHWDELNEPIDFELNKKWLAALEETKQAVLNLRVPIEFKELHLNLVLALDWEQRAVKDLIEVSSKVLSATERSSLIKLAQEKLRTSQDYYNQIFENYSWL